MLIEPIQVKLMETFLCPCAVEYIHIKRTGYFYDPVITARLIQVSLLQHCNIVVSIADHRMYYVDRKATWKPMYTSTS